MRSYLELFRLQYWDRRRNGVKQYYLSLGDSLARGYQPNGDNTHGYADQLYTFLQTQNPAVSLIKYGCSGETTSTFINGGCPFWWSVQNGYGTTPQLTAALNFITSHAGQVSPVTLDIGANDALGLFTASTCTVSATWQTDLAAFDARFRSILSQLRTALNGTGDLYLMDFYNPYQNQCAGTQVNDVFLNLNTTIRAAAAAYGVPVANVFDAFGGSVTPNPFINVYTWMYNGSSQNNIHPTTVGYGVISDALKFISCYSGAASFCFEVAPANQAGAAGSAQSADYVLRVNPTNGFTGPVGFTWTGFPVGATPSASSLSVSGPGVVSTPMPVSLASSTYPGAYTFSVAAASGSLTRSDSAQLNVTGPDFAIAASPASQTVTAGAGTTYTVTIMPAIGFAGNVTLSLTAPQAAGVTASFSPGVLSQGSSSLNVTTASTATPGTYTLTMTGTADNGLTRSTTVTLIVNGFTVSATPSSLSVKRGSSGNYTVTISALNGFNSTIGLGVSGLPSGATASFTPGSVTGSGSSTLKVSVARSSPVGTYPLTVTGTSAGVARSAKVTLVVN